MFTKIWRFLTLLLTALSLGTSFAHVLEIPAKLRYDGPLYVTLQSPRSVARRRRSDLCSQSACS